MCIYQSEGGGARTDYGAPFSVDQPFRHFSFDVLTQNYRSSILGYFLESYCVVASCGVGMGRRGKPGGDKHRHACESVPLALTPGRPPNSQRMAKASAQSSAVPTAEALVRTRIAAAEAKCCAAEDAARAA